MMWKYTDNSHKVVVRIDENGNMLSCLVTTKEIQDWIAAGNIPLNED